MSARVRRGLGRLSLASPTVLGGTASGVAQQLPEPPFHALLPHD
jgi:hypothetical protein